MGSWTGFLLTYLLGGLTFVPLVLATVLLHAYLTCPVRRDADGRDDELDSIVQPGDETTDLKAAQKARKEEPKSRLIDSSDVAAGYFAVCREYTPMGINAKPIERSTPVGSTTVAAPSPSVYQAMYRTIFERKPNSSPLDNGAGASGRPKRAGNVFYVVLRHGHLMLFDDDEQLEVRHVISLAHHEVSIYSGGDKTPEGELYIKRNALCLSRRSDGTELAPDSQLSKPFFLFSENCSAKEDFYFALLRNKEHVFGADNEAPQPQLFEVKNIISLVQKLHSSEEYLQTRWLNAFIGRIFLGVHKSTDLQNYIREKITKKISRVNRPSFLTRIAIQKIDTGESAPFIINPRLKDLNVEGDCVMEADIKYTGNFRLEVAATARIDLGARFKAREVNLVLAVVLKKLEGHILFKIKPPPSNRIWFSFQTMPKIEMAIEPIVSSRQITYTVILRQIENRIKEVVAETLVHPFWDDIPFFKTEHKQWRGGIFEGDDAVEHSEDYEAIAAALGDVDEVSQAEDNGGQAPGSPEMPPVEKSHSVPNLEREALPSLASTSSGSTGFWGRINTSKKNSTTSVNANQVASASTPNFDANSPHPSANDKPGPIRSGSFSASSPTVDTNNAHAEFKPSSPPPNRGDAAASVARVVAKSKPASGADTPGQKSPTPKTNDHASLPPAEAQMSETDNDPTPVPPARRNTTSSSESESSSPAPSIMGSVRSNTGSGRGIFARKDNPSTSQLNGNGHGNGTPEQKRTTLAAVSNVAATAKRWGLNALQRHPDQGPAGGRKLSDPPIDLSKPMGRGQPIPTSILPPPEATDHRKAKAATAIPVPKRRPGPPPEMTPSRSSTATSTPDAAKRKEIRPPPPTLPRRRRVSENPVDNNDNNSNNNGRNGNGSEDSGSRVFVVEAPTADDADSATPSPVEENEHYMRPWVEDEVELQSLDEQRRRQQDAAVKGAADKGGKVPPPTLPKRRATAEVEDEDDYSNWLDDSEVDDTMTTQGTQGTQGEGSAQAQPQPQQARPEGVA